MDKFEEVLREVPRVREDLGYPPLVTPTSQIVGTQAVLNIVAGGRYKMVPNEVKQLVKGMYGKTTVPIKDEIVKLIIGDEEVITCRPADLIEPELEKIKKEVAQYVEQDEDVLTRALFPGPSVEFFKYRNAKRYQIDSTLLNEEDMVYPVYRNIQKRMRAGRLTSPLCIPLTMGFFFQVHDLLSKAFKGKVFFLQRTFFLNLAEEAFGNFVLFQAFLDTGITARRLVTRHCEF
jgi:pyruvate carboxylase